MTPPPLTPLFFSRPTHTVAWDLIGMQLMRQQGTQVCAHTIAEVEVYDGPHDRASHASKGRTKRNEAMFGPPGHWYVYRCYGIHWMLNIVTREEGYPAAILLRGVVGVEGPGRLTRSLNITGDHNGTLAAPASGLWIADPGARVPRGRIARTPRIGVAYAGEWAHKPWRYVLQGAVGKSSHAIAAQEPVHRAGEVGNL